MSSKKGRRKEKDDSEEDIPSDESDGAPLPVSAGGAERRSSGRLRKMNRKVKQIDGETRTEVRNARLESLENDKWTQEVLNTGEADPAAAAAADDEYKEEEEDHNFSPGQKRRAKRGGTKEKERERGLKKSAAFRLVRNLNRILDELEAQADDKTDPTIVNYHTIAAGPSARPARHFCAVCGFPSDYHCVRCGTSFCSLRCNQTHQDISCLKFGA